MKVGIIGATGKLGQLLTKKSIEQGIETTAIVRNKGKLELDIPVVEKNLFDLTTSDIDTFDFVLNAFNAPVDEPNQFITSMEHLISIFRNTNTCLVIAGGAGILSVGEDMLLVDTPDFPEAFRSIAEAEVKAYRLLENEKTVNWLYMTPPALMDPSLPYKGKHYFSGDKLGVNENGESQISYEDYAEAFIEKVMNPENHKVIGVYS